MGLLLYRKAQLPVDDFTLKSTPFSANRETEMRLVVISGTCNTPVRLNSPSEEVTVMLPVPIAANVPSFAVLIESGLASGL